MKELLLNYLKKHVQLSKEEELALIETDIFLEVKKGEILLQAGDISNNGYFVLKGLLRKYYVIDGEEKTTAFFSEETSYTPRCVVKGGTSEYYISAVEDTLITTADSDLDMDFFNKFPKFEEVCRKVSSEQLVAEQKALDEFKYTSPEKRYLSLLENKPELLRRVPLGMLASYLGITPQSLSRLRKRIVSIKH
ncbi:MAG: Crp/Fnr family transcriptional regulator [Candidatus Kapaibacteriales bacterium]